VLNYQKTTAPLKTMEKIVVGSENHMEKLKIKKKFVLNVII
jgi:hypothetical protein